jgi:hypothetical protein
MNFGNLRECSQKNCKNFRLDESFCKTHGGVRKRCFVIKKNGDQCHFYVNDSGKKCCAHGGFSKKDIKSLNIFNCDTDLSGKCPDIVKRYTLFLINRWEESR